MDGATKLQRYERIRIQLAKVLAKTDEPTARMATVAALLHHKMPHFFWTGFYLLRDGRLTVGPYQGALACLVLEPAHTGVCWEAVDRGETLIVPDVRAFSGHIACDPRSRSEIVVPLRSRAGRVVGVLDVDSDHPAAFDDADRAGLESIASLLPGLAEADRA